MINILQPLPPPHWTASPTVRKRHAASKARPVEKHSSKAGSGLHPSGEKPSLSSSRAQPYCCTERNSRRALAGGLDGASYPTRQLPRQGEAPLGTRTPPTTSEGPRAHPAPTRTLPATRAGAERARMRTRRLSPDVSAGGDFKIQTASSLTETEGPVLAAAFMCRRAVC